jgi:hypothetical protein
MLRRLRALVEGDKYGSEAAHRLEVMEILAQRASSLLLKQGTMSKAEWNAFLEDVRVELDVYKKLHVKGK